MSLYVRYINPLVAVLVLGLCVWASVKDGDDKPVRVGNLLVGGLPTYFFAKGLFAATAIFLLGKITEHLLGRRPAPQDTESDPG